MDFIHISELNNELLSLYRESSEVQLRRINEPAPGVFIAESALVIERAIAAGFIPESVLIEEESKDSFISLLSGPAFDGVPVYSAPGNLLRTFTGYNLTRGILSVMKRRSTKSISDFLEGKDKIAVLESVVNPTNVGAIFRNAAALGIQGILLTPDCADPLYRRAIRVSMGNVFQVDWTSTSSDADWVKALSEYEFTTVALALSDNSVSITDPVLKGNRKIALVLGSEGYGLKDTTIMACDYVAKIPMVPGVDSLNVSAASALAFWEFFR